MKRYSIFLFCILTGIAVQAQDDKTTFSINYQYALPMGAFKNNFIDQPSARGLQAELLYHVKPKWRVGASLGWQDFYQKTSRQGYFLEDGSNLSAVRTRSLQTIPLLVKAQYTLTEPGKKFQPYLTAGAGANMVQVQEMFGQFDNINDVHFGFAAQAGGGFKYNITNRTAFTAGAVYNHMPFNRYEIGQVSHVGVQVGIRFTLRNNGGGNWGDDRWNGGDRRPRNRNFGGGGWWGPGGWW